ncbi:hypothetical protein [Burkholderia sp. Ac-20345]|uniref:hypothetical protein n=1 Tax=Burkholderia sp. Ac-20345 TaxID=2703891 RepID=UPI00197BBF53|nr:hypothetical protein [Burkholderia sp. Ac-20345]
MTDSAAVCESGSILVLVAIDDNDQAWYEMLIPFILSLRATDYTGRLGVIGYGLSARKQEILRGEGIELYKSVEIGDLAYDRFTSAARVIADDPSIEAVALYDADIWFPGPGFDVFEQVVDDGCVYVAPDPLFCTFITDPLTGPRREELAQQCVGQLIERLGGALQAGLVVGRRTAWERFGSYVRDCVSRINEDFVSIYGLDTTFLHLWGAAGGVSLLGPEQNFVSKWGLHERHDLGIGSVSFEHNGKLVRALHMTGDVRFHLNRWRYLTRHHAAALEQGARLSLPVPDGMDVLTPIDLAGLQLSRFRELGLEPIAARVDRFRDVAISIGDVAPGAAGLSISAWGAHEIEFDSTCAGGMLELNVTHLSGQPSCVHAQVARDGIAYPLQVPQNASLSVCSGNRLMLRALALPGQKCHVQWNIAIRVNAGDSGEAERHEPAEDAFAARPS